MTETRIPTELSHVTHDMIGQHIVAKLNNGEIVCGTIQKIGEMRGPDQTFEPYVTVKTPAGVDQIIETRDDGTGVKSVTVGTTYGNVHKECTVSGGKKSRRRRRSFRKRRSSRKRRRTNKRLPKY